MTIQVVADGADGYRLLSENNDLVGWVRGQAIGVSGFANDDAIGPAAIRSYNALSAWLERQHLHPLPEIGEKPVRWTHDGAYRWLLVGHVPIARLPTRTLYGGKTSKQAFEIVLKGSISDGMTIHAALVALRAAHGSIAAADIEWAERRKTSGASSSLAPTTHLELGAL